MSRPTDLSFKPFGAPRFWPYWLAWFAMRGVASLPYRAQRSIGALLGQLAWITMRRRKRIALRNLEICFPELTTGERATLLRKHFAAIGMSFVEMGMGWFMPQSRLRSLCKINGIEHLDAAKRHGTGILMFCAHFTTLELCVSQFEHLFEPCACMYRTQRNAMVDVMIRRGRSRFAQRQIPRDSVRELIRLLKNGYLVIYLPDQTYIGNQSELLPFFGELAVTNTATSKLAAISGATVLSYFYRRVSGNRGYEIDILPAPHGIPSDEPIEDSKKLFAVLESKIRETPEQYLWVYKKFKRRPADLPDLYDGI
jgi:KDO2-lipid IV(A) lauroyltransferase